MWQVFLTVLAILVLAVVGGVALVVLRARSLRRRHRAQLAALEPEHSAPGVLFGIASHRARQQRGPGTLVLGRTVLGFVQLAPERVVRVPRDSITSVSASTTFLGKTRGRPLLVVTWREDGLDDALAVDVDDVDGWRDRLG